MRKNVKSFLKKIGGMVYSLKLYTIAKAKPSIMFAKR